MTGRTMTRAEVEAVLDRIQQHRGVSGLIIVSGDGTPLRSSVDNTATLQYVGMCRTLCAIAGTLVRDVDPQNELKILRVRTKKYEVMMAPQRGGHVGGEFLIVIQAAEQPQQPVLREILD